MDRRLPPDGIYWYRLEDVDVDGKKTFHNPISITVHAQDMVDRMPTAYALYQNHPNPFNPVTTIAYDLPEPCDVTLAIYTITGQHVATLVSGHQKAGHYEVVWDTGGLGNGMYVVQLHAGSFVQTRKMLKIE